VKGDSWQKLEFNNLTEGSFIYSFLNGGSSSPDFSENGAPIHFGYYASNGASEDSHTTYSGIDNWSVTIYPVQQ